MSRSHDGSVLSPQYFKGVHRSVAVSRAMLLVALLLVADVGLVAEFVERRSHLETPRKFALDREM